LTMSLYESSPAGCNGLAEPVTETAQTASAAEDTLPTPARQQPRPRHLRWGSDVEIAGLIQDELKRDYRTLPFCDGEFWRYIGTYWEPVLRQELRRVVHAYDGLPFGERGRVRLNKSRIDSILNELGVILSAPNFFEARRVGINCQTGFITFEQGTPQLLPHDPEHRQRHVIPARWEPGGSPEIPDGSLLARLLHGSFEGDDDANKKIDLIAEIAGAAALGHGPKHTAPKAVVLLGRTAENGKSQILDLLRGLLPLGAVSSVPPSRFGDDRHIVKLVGKLLNTSDELGTAEAIASDRFKAMITGEPLTGRDVYRPAFDFRPQAQHVFAIPR
jgi:hypothetical protein